MGIKITVLDTEFYIYTHQLPLHPLKALLQGKVNPATKGCNSMITKTAAIAIKIFVPYGPWKIRRWLNC